MKSIFYALLIGLFYAQPTFAQNCKELFIVASNNYAFEQDDIIVDSVFGTLKVVHADVQDDILEVYRLDPHIARQSGIHHRQIPTQITPFKNRILAKIPSTASGKIIRSRVTSTYTFSALRYYFALYRIIDLLAENSSNFNLKEQLREYLDGILNKPSEAKSLSPQEILNSWTYNIFERKLPKGLNELILRMENLTGENLVQSGILSSLARRSSWQNDRLAWPPSHGRKASIFFKADGTQSNVDLSVESDIDHFSRSYLFSKNPAAALPRVSLEHFKHSMEATTYKPPNGEIFVIEKESEISQYLNFEYKKINFSRSGSSEQREGSHFAQWRELLSIAQTPVDLQSVRGRAVLFFISESLPNVDAVAAHLRQVAWSNGATLVSQIMIEINQSPAAATNP